MTRARSCCQLYLLNLLTLQLSITTSMLAIGKNLLTTFFNLQLMKFLRYSGSWSAPS